MPQNQWLKEALIELQKLDESVASVIINTHSNEDGLSWELATWFRWRLGELRKDALKKAGITLP